MRNSGLVPFPGLRLGLLATPPQADQEAPDVIGVVVDSKAPVDDLGDPAGGPQIGGIAGGLRPGQKEFDQRGRLSFEEFGRPARRGLGRQALAAPFLEELAP